MDAGVRHSRQARTAAVKWGPVLRAFGQHQLRLQRNHHRRLQHRQAGWGAGEPAHA
jgi:hypothetical protein